VIPPAGRVSAPVPAEDRLPGMGGMRSGVLRLIVAAIAAAVLLGVAAQAAAQGGYEEPTRKQWVRQADRICEQPYKEGNRIVDRFRELAERERWVPAGRLLMRLGKLVLGVTDRVGELARPPADDEAIQTYLGGEERGAELLKEAGQVLRRKKVRQAAKLLDRSDRIVTRSHKAVDDFGLRECI
jgi:hypothetical protein